MNTLEGDIHTFTRYKKDGNILLRPGPNENLQIAGTVDFIDHRGKTGGILVNGVPMELNRDLEDLQNVVMTSITDNDIVMRNGTTSWTNRSSDYLANLIDIEDLRNVSVSVGVTEGQIMMYGQTGWENRTAGTVATLINLDELKDASMPTIIEDDIVMRNGTNEWVNRTPDYLANLIDLSDLKDSSTSMGIASQDNIVMRNETNEWTNRTPNYLASLIDLEDLANVVGTGVTSNNVMLYGETSWENRTPEYLANLLDVEDLSNVNVTGVTSGQILVYGTTSWENQDPSFMNLKLDELEDADMPTLVNDDIVMRRGETAWVNRTPDYLANLIDLSDLKDSSNTMGTAIQDNIVMRNEASEWTNRTPDYLASLIDIEDLGNVNVGVGVTTNDVLMFGTTAWENKSLSYLNGLQNLSELNDVNIPTVSTNDLLIYGATSWYDISPSAMASAHISVSDLSDTTIALPVANQVLVYNALGQWVNGNNIIDLYSLLYGSIIPPAPLASIVPATLPILGLSVIGHIYWLYVLLGINFIGDIAEGSAELHLDIEDLDNVTVTGVTSGDMLIYNPNNNGSTAWENVPAVINNLKDVITTGVTDYDILRYSGTAYYNVADTFTNRKDVVLTDIANNDIMIKGTTHWYNIDAETYAENHLRLGYLNDVDTSGNDEFDVLMAGGVGNNFTLKSLSYVAGNNLNLNGLKNVFTGTESADEYLKYTGTAWINSEIVLNDIKNVNIFGQVAGNVIKYNGTNWVAGNVAGDIFPTATYPYEMAQFNGTAWEARGQTDFNLIGEPLRLNHKSKETMNNAALSSWVTNSVSSVFPGEINAFEYSNEDDLYLIGSSYINTSTVASIGSRSMTFTTTTSAVNYSRTITYSHELDEFLTVDETGTDKISLTSKDSGISWLTANVGAVGGVISIKWISHINKYLIATTTGIRYTNEGYSSLWSTVTGGSNDVKDFASDGTTIVAVAWYSPYIFTSTDGLTWTSRTCQAAFYNSVCYMENVGRFVAVAGNSAYSVYSSDGITWTTSTSLNSPYDAYWTDVCHNSATGYAYAVGFQGGVGNNLGVISRSGDGITWTSLSVNTSAAYISVSYVYDTSLIYAVDYNQKIWMSSDGETFAISKSVPTAGTGRMAYSTRSGIFCVVGQDSNANRISRSVEQIAVNKLYYSKDLTTFTPCMVPFIRRRNIAANTANNRFILSICYSKEKQRYVASGDGIVFYSDNGKEWYNGTIYDYNDPRNDTTGGVYGSKVIWAPSFGKFYLMNVYSVYESSDGINFYENNYINRTSVGVVKPTSLIVDMIETSEGLEVLILDQVNGTNSAGLMLYNTDENGTDFRRINVYSTNSPSTITWDTNTFPSGDSYQTVKDVTYITHLDKYIFSTGGGGTIQSSDGLTWTTVSSAVQSRSIAYNGSIIVSVSDNNVANNIQTSTNGSTWTTRTVAANYLNKVIWISELSLFVAVGRTQNPRIVTSPDGITWTTRSSLSYNYSDVTYSPGLNLIVAVGNDTGSPATAQISTSSDGITWVSRSPGLYPFSLSRISYIPGNPDRFIGLGKNTKAIYSDDGITWTTTTISPSSYQDWTAVKYIDGMGKLMAISNNAFAIDGLNNPVKEIYTSDGITWTTTSNIAAISASTSSIAQFAIGYEKSQNVLCVISENRCSRWKLLGVGYKLAYSSSDDALGVIGYSPSTIQTSFDYGENWSYGTDYFYDNFDYIKELGIFMTKTSTVGRYSLDGISWTSFSFPSTASKGMKWNKTLNKLSTVGYGSTIRMISSNTTWPTITYPKEVSLGTSIISDTKVVGKTVDVGTGANSVKLGENSNEVKVGNGADLLILGNPLTEVKINGYPVKKYYLSALCNDIDVYLASGTIWEGYANFIDSVTEQNYGSTITMPHRGIYSIEAALCGVTSTIGSNATLNMYMFHNGATVQELYEQANSSGVVARKVYNFSKILYMNEGDTIRFFGRSSNGAFYLGIDDSWELYSTYLNIMLLEYR